MVTLLALCAHNNESVRLQCQNLVSGEEICAIVSRDIPMALRVRWLELLDTAYIRVLDVREKLQQHVWKCAIRMTHIAVDECNRKLLNKTSMLQVALLPLMESLLQAASKWTHATLTTDGVSQRDFGEMFKEPSVAQQLKDLFSHIWYTASSLPSASSVPTPLPPSLCPPFLFLCVCVALSPTQLLSVSVSHACYLQVHNRELDRSVPGGQCVARRGWSVHPADILRGRSA